MPKAPTLFFAPTYYSPFYFPTLVAPATLPRPSPGGSPSSRDRDAFNAIVAVLRATGEFAAVAFGTTLEHWAAGSNLTPAAIITPDFWAELDDADPVQLVRRVDFTITIVVRDEDPATRFDILDRLTSVVQNAIDGSDLGGGCLAALTLIRRGRFDPGSKHPEQAVVLRGEFTFLIPSQTGHDPSY